MSIKSFDVIITGAGAAGLMCAAVAKSRGRKVLIIDHETEVGKKIRISGGGRCNFTNLYSSPKNFISNNPHFCVSALKRFTQEDFINLVKKHEIAFHEKTLGQLFCDKSSKEIVNMLLSMCEGVDIWLETKVKKISKILGEENINFEIATSRESLKCESLVIATGGPAIPKMGASAFGYQVAEQFDINVVTPEPALVPFLFDEELLLKTKSLSGVSADAIVSFDKTKFREAVLFTHRGISGPAILQISSYYEKNQEITINFAPDIDVYTWLQEERKSSAKQEIHNVLSKILPKSFVKFILDEVQINGFMADLSNQKLKEIATQINSWKFTAIGDEGFAKAEVAKGGVDVEEISSKTFESKKVKGLFFIGEVLDVTGHLGGHNFQWAWASGNAAGSFA